MGQCEDLDTSDEMKARGAKAEGSDLEVLGASLDAYWDQRIMMEIMVANKPAEGRFN